MSMPNSPAGSGQPTQIQLHDIHVPEQVSNFPIAPGWWILLALIIIMTLWLYKKHKTNSRLNADKKQALAVLANNESLSAKECITLLKWAAMQYFSRQQLAKLYGMHFQEFLVKQLPLKHQDSFKQLTFAAFDNQYQAGQSQSEQTAPSTIDKDCQHATKLWLTHALPIKKSLAIESEAELIQ